MNQGQELRVKRVLFFDDMNHLRSIESIPPFPGNFLFLTDEYILQGSVN